MEKKIINKESFSSGKKQGKNDDAIYVGKNFAAVIDGVSHKSSVLVDGKKVKIAEIITEAIKKMDRPEAPVYAKTLSFEECVEFINLYIKEYLQRYGMADQVGKMEATGVIYSNFHNQIWIVGDCRAIYDGNIVQNPLKIDEVYVDIRKSLIEALKEEGYTEKELIENDISRDIIKQPELLSQYIKSSQLRAKVEEYRVQRINQALFECGFSPEEIEEQGLIQKYYNPRDLQKVLKNNPNMGSFGYAVFNGENTEIKNCKVEKLPENVRTIKMFSDGFPIDALDGDKDIGHAVRTIHKRASIDRLSTKINPATHMSVRYSKSPKREEEYAIDDASAVIIEIAREEREADGRGEK